MQLMTTTALALSVAACGSSNGADKVIDVTDITEEAQAKRTFATDEDGDPVDAGAAIASGKTLTARAVGVALQNLNYHTGETSTTTDVTASIKRNDDGALTVTIDGEELAFTPADVNGEGDGYEVEVDGKSAAVYNFNGPVEELLTAGNGFAQVVNIFRSSENAEGHVSGDSTFAILGTETADADLKDLPKAQYSGRSRVNVVPNSGFESNRESRFKVRSEVAMTADFGAGEVWGTIGNTTVEDPETGDIDSVGGTVSMDKSSFDNNGFAGTLTPDETFIDELDVVSLSGNYSGAFYGPDADEVAGVMTWDLVAPDRPLNGSGFFTADKVD
ncbi:transferrin-binding protein-like solute binding protein [Sulfitobacter pontiacus]|uniref:transferrin-binding protein-like solute binding protein n=1 Tax=Sulfitobacter pontiacus TaxID=60137 RepID=UPI0032642258